VRRFGLALMVVAFGLSTTGRAGSPDPCEAAKRINGWCEAVNAGYVASVEVRSRFLYEVLDTHGHDIDPVGMKCETCRNALQNDGYCPAHKMGYVHGEAFLSPLTYYLARARKIEPSTVSCRVCRRHTRGIGWCEKDRVGIAGYFALDDRQEFSALERAYEILLAAVEKSSECETCAGAMIADGYCAIHHLKYEGGRPVTGGPI